MTTSLYIYTLICLAVGAVIGATALGLWFASGHRKPGKR